MRRDDERAKTMIKTDSSTWAKQLNAALLHRPSDWTFTGATEERKECDGNCACGHCGLKFLFQLQDKVTQKTVWVGSVCIDTYSQLPWQTTQDVLKASKELKKKSRLRTKYQKSLNDWISASDSHPSKKHMLDIYSRLVTKYSA